MKDTDFCQLLQLFLLDFVSFENHLKIPKSSSDPMVQEFHNYPNFSLQSDENTKVNEVSLENTNQQDHKLYLTP
jgi:hypothetical protein